MQCIAAYATGIRSYIKSVLRYKFLIMDTYQLDTLDLREQGCEDLWLFFVAKRGTEAKKFGKHCLRLSSRVSDSLHLSAILFFT
jgi:hypothetical protein